MSFRFRACLALLPVAAVLTAQRESAFCITRDEVMANFAAYLNLGYEVRTENAYPSNKCGNAYTYTSTCYNTVPGTNWIVGEAYSYGNWDTPAV